VNDDDEETIMDDDDGVDRLDDDDEEEEDENEDEDDADEIEHLRVFDRERVRRQIDDNDPSLHDVFIGDYSGGYMAHDGDWKAFGASLGRNTHIKFVSIHLNATQMGVQIVHFFQGLARNRSIKSLDIIFDAESSDMFPLMAPFFMNNNSLETLEITREGRWVDGCLSKIAFALGQFNSLITFSLMGDNSKSIISEGQDVSRELIEALAGHAGLNCLSLKNVPIRQDSCVTLADLLRNPQVSLESLKLFRTDINDEGADILSSGLIRNHTLTDFDINRNGFTEIGWQAIFAMLTNPQCRLVSLDLGSTDINDAVARSLVNALRCNSSLKSLFLEDIHSITATGWRDLFAGILQGQHCMLEKLDLSDSRGEDPDRMMESLADALAVNVNLKELHLFNFESATSIGWQSLATILRNPSSALDSLHLNRHVHSEIVVLFAAALANNTKLKQLFSIDMRGVTSVGYDALSRMLCDTSTILSTFNSNHTLEYTGFLPREDIKSLLIINHSNSVRQAARIKIINSHFSGNVINTQVFSEMKLSVLPTVIAWMGCNNGMSSDKGSNGGMNLMFEFLRRVPLICDTKSTSKKRKAASAD
jgi:hypothetical protein